MAVAIPTGLIPVSSETSSTENGRAPAPTPRRARESLRERIARHLAGTSPASNYEAMCQAIATDFSGRPPCEACGGAGYRELSRNVTEQLDDRLENQLAELELKQKALAEANDDASRCRRGDPEVDERLREDARRDADKLAGEIIRLHESMEDDRKKRKRRARCRTCQGSGKGPLTKDGDAGRPDSMFSTVTCRTCRGLDARKHGLLPNRHYGSSSGELRMRGPRIIPDPEASGVYTVRPHPRDDAAAELHDTCPTCRGDDGQGTGYVVPITVRPVAKTAPPADEIPEEVHEHFPESDFDDPVFDPHDADDFLELTRRDDPHLAAAIAAYLGASGDAWAKNPWGRRFALWPLTDAGRTLASESRQEAKGTGYPRLLALCSKERGNEVTAAAGSPRRRVLLARADNEARLLERRVERALSEAGAA